MKKVKSPKVKFLSDFLPLVIFFTVYKFYSTPNPLIAATFALLLSTAIAITINYLVNKEIANTALFSAIILAIFGVLTIFSGNETFIKIKPTLINLIFATILIVGYFLKKPLLKFFLDNNFQMNESAWLILSLRWALFFIFLAILNEFIWRNFATDLWVKFKVFGILPITIVFTLSQVPYIIKNRIDKYCSNSKSSQKSF